MARDVGKKKPSQPPLIPLTDEELKAAPRKLANLIEELEELEAEHKTVRAEQTKARKKVNGQIKALAGQIRHQGR
jgi:hypothetical protein